MERRSDARITVVIRKCVWSGIAAHAGFIPLFLWAGYPRLAGFNVLSVAMWVSAALANRRGGSTAAMWIIFTEVVAHAIFATMTLGWVSGFQDYLFPLIPFIMFNERLKTAAVSAASAGVLLVFAALRAFSPVRALDPKVGTFLAYTSIAVPFVVLSILTYWFRAASIGAEQRMERAALTDPLTGLFNRRHMNDRLQTAEAQFARNRRPFCLILADIDHFKRINDERGHDVGDRVLCAVARLLEEEVRGADAVARWGGEEFLILLSEVTIDRAADVAHRLRVAAETRLSGMAGLNGAITLTFGLSVYAGGGEVGRVLKSADEALYAGKAAGRNRVVVADATTSAPGGLERSQV